MKARKIINVRSTDGKPATLLVCGAIAGPLFTLAWLVQGLVRANYDPMRHAVSSLSVGERGWIQIATFIVAGSLVLALAAGLRRRLQPPSGSTWGPLLIGLMGIGLIGSGIFVTDPLNGYPPGAPIIPIERTVHGILHDLFGIPFFLGLPIACLVFARFFARQGDRDWAWYSRLSGIAMFAVFFVARLGFRLLPTYPALAEHFGLLQRITITIGFAWLTVLAVHMMNVPSMERKQKGPLVV
jgi:hypothetical protein